MTPATRFDDRVTHARYVGLRITEHYLTFFDGFCTEHWIELKLFGGSPPMVIEYSDKSKYIGLTLEQCRMIDWNWQENTWEASIAWLNRHPSPELWIIGRLAFLKEYTCDHEVPQALIKALREAK